MKKFFTTYIPWLFLMAFPALFCMWMYGVQFVSIGNFAVDWSEGILIGLYNLALAGMSLFLILSGITLSLLTLLRLFWGKLGQKKQWLQWAAAGTLALYAFCFLGNGIIAVFMTEDGVSNLASDLLHAIIPAAAAYLLLKGDEMKVGIRWLIIAAMAVVIVAKDIFTFYLPTEELLIEGTDSAVRYVLGILLIVYCSLCPLIFALAPTKKTISPKEDSHDHL